MALGALGVLDLSIITDTLINLLDSCIATSPVVGTQGPPKVTGSMPESVRNEGGCQLSLYLFHVEQDKFQRNSPVMGPRGPQPLSLDLYYLLTAYADKDYVQEQQAMSIAMRCFYNTPIIKTVVQGDPHQEFTLSMEIESADEMSRMWQAMATTLRLSATYKVSVVFITPDIPDTKPAPHPKRIGLTVNPTDFPFITEGQVFGTLRSVSYPTPDNSVAHPDIRHYDSSPAVVAAGEQFILAGSGLKQKTSSRVYLLYPDGTEYEVTSWIVPTPISSPPPGQTQVDSAIRLQLPTTVATLPGSPPDTPPAGIYQLRVGSDAAQGDEKTVRSNATPFSIAAHVDGPASNAAALLSLAGGVFTLTGAGFGGGLTEVLLDTIPLTATNGAPNAGEFQVNGTGTSIVFKLPGALAPGLYTVRVRVNNVESAPAWWVQV